MCGIWGLLTLNYGFISDINLHDVFMKINHRGSDELTAGYLYFIKHQQQ